jgi:hypothetical protein
MQLRNDVSAKESRAVIEGQITILVSEYNEIEARVRATSPAYAAITQPQPPGVKEIQQLLGPNTLLLEYALGDQHSYLWVISATSIASFELPARKEIEEAATHLYALLTAHSKKINGEREQQRELRLEKAEAEFLPAASRLSDMLLTPAARLLGAKRLVIVAEGALQYVPFNVLPISSAADAVALSDKQVPVAGVTQHPRAQAGALISPPTYQPLITSHEVVTLPSISTLAVLRAELQGRKPAPQSVAILADPVFNVYDDRVKVTGKGAAINSGVRPGMRDLERAANDTGVLDVGSNISRLPFSGQEARAIVAAARKAKLVLGFDANLSMAKSPELGDYRVVHFATHGLVDSKHPELSGIVLSLLDRQGRPQEGFLRLNAIYKLRLPVELVVLSACQTGLGKEVRGEGLVGLTRGFMYAGAARVIASLWKVDDEATSELMGYFYKEMIGADKPPSEALRSAQLNMLKQRRWKYPYYWAAFTIQGEWK